MNYKTVSASDWLEDKKLTEQGRFARVEYEKFCNYLDAQDMLSYQSARAKYFLQSHNYWTLPDGYALPPHTINVCVNNICNLKCRYCDFGQHHDETFYHKYNVVDRTKKIELPLELCKRIVDESKWFRPIIRASFREPMLYNDILPFIEYTKTNDLPFWLLTNGFNLAKYAKDLLRLNTDSIRLSLDGPDYIHDKVRGVKGAYGKMMQGLKILLEEKEKLESNIQVGFYFTVNDYNSDKILETVEALENEGILDKVFLNFQWLLYTTKEMAKQHNAKDAATCGGYVDESTVQTVDLEKIDVDAMAEQTEIIKKKYPARKGYRIHFRPSFEKDDLEFYKRTEDFPFDNARCKMLWYNFNINPAGKVKSFHHCLLPEAGDVKEDSIMDIWNGKIFREQRRKLQENRFYTGCKRCWGVYCQLEDKKRKMD